MNKHNIFESRRQILLFLLVQIFEFYLVTQSLYPEVLSPEAAMIVVGDPTTHHCTNADRMNAIHSRITRVQTLLQVGVRSYNSSTWTPAPSQSPASPPVPPSPHSSTWHSLNRYAAFH
jgi:hypothetical protein